MDIDLAVKLYVLTSGNATLARSTDGLLALMPRFLRRPTFSHCERFQADGEPTAFVDANEVAIIVEVEFFAGIMWVVICRRR